MPAEQATNKISDPSIKRRIVEFPIKAELAVKSTMPKSCILVNRNNFGQLAGSAH